MFLNNAGNSDLLRCTSCAHTNRLAQEPIVDPNEPRCQISRRGTNQALHIGSRIPSLLHTLQGEPVRPGDSRCRWIVGE